MNNSVEVIRKINQIIMANVSHEKCKDYHCGEFVHWPNQRGFFEYADKWFVYNHDERNFCTITGPFGNNSIIYACAIELHIPSEVVEEYKFSVDEMKIYYNSNFHSLAEMQEYMNTKI